MKILYVDPAVRTLTSAKYKYYDGLFDELEKLDEVKVYLTKDLFIDYEQFIKQKEIKPDVVIFGLGWFEKMQYFGKIENLNVPAICHIFKPQNFLEKKLEFCRINDIDLITTPIPTYKQYEERTGVRTILFPNSFDSEIFKPRKDIEKKYDIGFSGALHHSSLYPPGSYRVENLRPKIGEILSRLNDINVFWKSTDNSNNNFIDSHEEYAKTINSSKIWIATLAAFGDVVHRYYEVLGSGTLLFCEKVPEAYKFLLKDGVNCVEFKDDLSDFEEKMRYYINNPSERKKITDNAVKFFQNNWTWKHCAEKLIRLTKEV